MNANRIEYRNTVALTARQNLKSPTENDSTARRSTAETLIRINQHVCRMFACNNSLRTIRFNPIAVYLVRDAGRKQRLNLFVPSRTMISHHLRSKLGIFTRIQTCAATSQHGTRIFTFSRLRLNAFTDYILPTTPCRTPTKRDAPNYCQTTVPSAHASDMRRTDAGHAREKLKSAALCFE